MSWTKTVKSDTHPDVFYTLKHDYDIFSCSCQSWRRQYSPITSRTCKHLIRELGEDHEKARAPESFSGMTRHPPKNRRSKPASFVDPMKYHVWSTKNDEKEGFIKNWEPLFYSIKLDGAFARWHEGHLYTKSGRQLSPPTRVTENLPRGVTLDGEIYAGTGPKQRNLVRLALAGRWSPKVKFIVFDLVDCHLTFEERHRQLEALHQKKAFPMVRYHRAAAPDDLQRAMDRLYHEEPEEEGLVLRYPEGRYESGKRSHNTLKWKPRRHGKAEVTGVEQKKKGWTVTLKDLSGEASTPFRTHVAKKKKSTSPGVEVGEIVDFTYSGRDEQGKPEIVKILHASKPTVT